jgi:hypothetical protein
MKKNIFALALLAIVACAVSFGQSKKASISFATDKYDFGKIQESAGQVSYDFVFTNTGGEPLVISNVQTSCGCTSPNWPKEPVLPGAKNKITVTYNPAGRPGKFTKSITVTSNAEPASNTVFIMGDVIPKEPTIEDKFPQDLGKVRMKTTQFAFNAISPVKVNTSSAELYNSSDSAVVLGVKNVPNWMQVKITPEKVQPKQNAVVEVTYDAKAKNDWGFVVDKFDLTINGVPAKARLTVTGNIMDDFSSLTPEQKANAPKIVIDSAVYDFGAIKTGDKAKYDYIVKNNGKSDLLIRKIATSCGCTATNLKSQIVKPGESTIIAVEFNSAGKSGNQAKQITVISNDPENPKTMLTIKGVVNAQ